MDEDEEETIMKKLVAVLLTLCMLAACTAAFAEKLVMGTNAAFPPYEYYEDEAIVGIDAEIAQAIAAKLGMDLEIADMDFKAIIPAVTEGKIDFGMAGMTVTEERLQSVNFSDTYATGIQAIIIVEGSEITSVDDLYAGELPGRSASRNPQRAISTALMTSVKTAFTSILSAQMPWKL